LQLYRRIEPNIQYRPFLSQQKRHANYHDDHNMVIRLCATLTGNHWRQLEIKAEHQKYIQAADRDNGVRQVKKYSKTPLLRPHMAGTGQKWS
jgi:hypothetical protein